MPHREHPRLPLGYHGQPAVSNQMIQIKSMKGHQQQVIRKDNVTYTIQKEQDNNGNFQNTVSIQNMQSQGANRMRVLHSTTPDLTSSSIREVNLQQF